MFHVSLSLNSETILYSKCAILRKLKCSQEDENVLPVYPAGLFHYSKCGFITNELAFRGEFSQEYELWLLNSTSEHDLHKVICVNEGCGYWKLVRNTFHKDIFVYVLKICAWDYSDGDVLNHQATFFSHLGLLWKDKGKHVIFLKESVFPWEDGKFFPEGFWEMDS